ncbi:unnamed protein product [Soboliphyme baturini]|uniref:ATP synthase subunit e, mitochondrial n=1 Tax=Soboliphyme baturini TaxID=241478 RepID=A0A183IJ07_9BILA|nr:unnamed protein product [Soboliphyme baturini]
MWPAFWVVSRTYAPYIMFPVAFALGFIGYNVEKRWRRERDKLEYLNTSVKEQRMERIMSETSASDPLKVPSLKEKLYVPESSLERNLPAADGKFW